MIERMNKLENEMKSMMNKNNMNELKNEIEEMKQMKTEIKELTNEIPKEIMKKDDVILEIDIRMNEMNNKIQEESD